MDRLTIPRHASILVQPVNMEDYPDYAILSVANNRPGLALLEYEVTRGIRYAAITGYALSVAYFYGVHRLRLPFSERPLAKLHHFFYPSAAYSTPVGAVLGGLHCASVTTMEVEEGRMQQRLDQELSTARDSMAHYEHRQQQALKYLSEAYGETRLRLWKAAHRTCQWLGHPLVPPSNGVVGELPASIGNQIQRVGLSRSRSSVDEWLIPGSVSWISRNTTVHDPHFYDKGRYSKGQMDVLVSEVMQRRSSPVEDRWLRTAARFAFMGACGTVLTWNSGGALYRLSMGVGLGVTVASVVSSARLDELGE